MPEYSLPAAQPVSSYPIPSPLGLSGYSSYPCRQVSSLPDALTRRWDVYPKEGDSDYTTVNTHNLRPIFSQEQLAISLRASFLHNPILCAIHLADAPAIHANILASLPTDVFAQEMIRDLKAENPSKTGWSLDSSGYL